YWPSANGSNGTVNAGIDTFANSVKALNKKVFITIHHEPENDVSGGGSGCSGLVYAGSSGTPYDYRAMWQNVRNRFDNIGATNVVWVMDYMNYPRWACLVNDLYPGYNL